MKFSKLLISTCKVAGLESISTSLLKKSDPIVDLVEILNEF